jgi:hypothetical protein
VTATIPMTPTRRTILVLGVPVALALIGWTAFTTVALADQVGYRVHVSVPASGRSVGVSVGNADATVRPGAGSRYSVSGTLRGSLARPTFAWRSTAAGLTLDSSCPMPAGSCSAGYDIAVPGGLPVTVTGVSGDLNASGFRGGVTLTDSSGDLDASGLAGAISLADGSGDITASGLNGESVRLGDSSGDIVVTGLAGTDVTGTDGSGDITLTFTTVPQRVDVTDSSGDITLVLPRGPASYQVSASSVSGDVTDAVKESPSSRHVIIASDGSGDVTIAY